MKKMDLNVNIILLLEMEMKFVLNYLNGRKISTCVDKLRNDKIISAF